MPAELDLSQNSYLSYTAPQPVDLSSITSVQVQDAGHVGELQDSWLLCVPRMPSADQPSEPVQQVKAWLEQQENVSDVEVLQAKKRVKRAMGEF